MCPSQDSGVPPTKCSDLQQAARDPIRVDSEGYLEDNEEIWNISRGVDVGDGR